MNTKLSFLMIALLFACYVKAQNTITVDNSVGANAQYSDLQSAISAASNGDIIYAHASEINYGDIIIDKPLNLVGFGHSDPDKETLINDIILGANASNTKISGIHITDDFLVTNNNTLTNLIIENNLFDGTVSGRSITFSNGGADNVIFRGNIITSSFGAFTTSSTQNIVTNLILANNIFSASINIRFHESTTIKNNIFLEEPAVFNLEDDTGNLVIQNCIFYAFSSSLYDPNRDGILFENCLTYNIGSSSVTTLVGTNNLNNQNPNFVSANDASYDSTDDYNLQAGSPAISNGTGGVDIGIYDGSAFTFNNFGYTNGIPTVKITDITDRIAPGATLSVTISTNAN